MLLTALLLQVYVVSFFRALYNRDFSVDTVLQNTTYSTGLWIALLPLTASLTRASLLRSVMYWAVQLLLSLLCVNLLQRLSLLDWQKLITIQGLLLVSMTTAGITQLWGLSAGIAILSMPAARVLDAHNKKSRYATQFNRYAIYHYRQFCKRYSPTVSTCNLDKKQVKLLYGIMIIENANTPKAYRLLEAIIQKTTKQTMTTGIMQVRSNTLLSDKQSIKLAAKLLRCYGKGSYSMKHMMHVGNQYNGEETYGELLAYIVGIIGNIDSKQ